MAPCRKLQGLTFAGARLTETGTFEPTDKCSSVWAHPQADKNVLGRDQIAGLGVVVQVEEEEPKGGTTPPPGGGGPPKPVPAGGTTPAPEYGEGGSPFGGPSGCPKGRRRPYLTNGKGGDKMTPAKGANYPDPPVPPTPPVPPKKDEPIPEDKGNDMNRGMQTFGSLQLRNGVLVGSSYANRVRRGLIR